MMLENAVSLSQQYKMLPQGGHVLCAVSGGADSMCLLHWLASRVKAGTFLLSAAHFDHQLREEESRADARFVEKWCREWGIPYYLGTGDVRGTARSAGLGIEETARVMRYSFLEKTAGKIGADRIATAHNADDNAETLLLHLIRGTGLQGLSGIPPQRGIFVRPLLTTCRTEILAYLEKYEISHVEDSTNSDVSYTRNRVRHQIMPLLRQINPRLNDSLNSAAAYFRADNDYLNAQAEEVAGTSSWRGEELVIEAAQVALQPDPIAVRIIRLLLIKMGAVQYRAAHLLSVVRLSRAADPSGRVDLPQGLTARRVYTELILTLGSRELPLPFQPERLNLDGVTEIPEVGWRVTCRHGRAPTQPPQNPNHIFINPASLTGELILRPRISGDRITLPRRGGKTLKKLFIDEGIPRGERERIPLLSDERGPVWLAGFGPDASKLAEPCGAALEIKAVRVFQGNDDTGSCRRILSPT